MKMPDGTCDLCKEPWLFVWMGGVGKNKRPVRKRCFKHKTTPVLLNKPEEKKDDGQRVPGRSEA